ncbi:hypothetical protein BDY21DRAFT_30190 [Lineolata rhizophorae]|uniref:Uncharacterized protein n=1 Tax=Lineolata rhizophorae TaxID=578093 RepID=A0A6A6P1M6_9PEZI|nr:hypothetical protein BDY21DRAFT_30190 [Lineolata rhizophorae]
MIVCRVCACSFSWLSRGAILINRATVPPAPRMMTSAGGTLTSQDAFFHLMFSTSTISLSLISDRSVSLSQMTVSTPQRAEARLSIQPSAASAASAAYYVRPHPPRGLRASRAANGANELSCQALTRATVGII